MALTARPSSSASRRQAERLDEARDALSKGIVVGNSSFDMFVRTRVPGGSRRRGRSASDDRERR